MLNEKVSPDLVEVMQRALLTVLENEKNEEPEKTLSNKKPEPHVPLHPLLNNILDPTPVCENNTVFNILITCTVYIVYIKVWTHDRAVCPPLKLSYATLPTIAGLLILITQSSNNTVPYVHQKMHNPSTLPGASCSNQYESSVLIPILLPVVVDTNSNPSP
jgi:hypothetical protein